MSFTVGCLEGILDIFIGTLIIEISETLIFLMVSSEMISLISALLL